MPASPAGTPEADLSVVIVTYNVRELLEQALRAVQRASSGLEVEVFVVDNDSADGTARMVRSRFPDVHLIANEQNTGFAVANNQAIRLAAGRHVLVLNPDTVVQEDTLRTLVRFMDDHPEAGAAGCRILNPDGTFAPESRRAFPTPSVAFYRMTGLGRLFPRSPRFGRYNLTYLPKNEVCEVDALSGSCMVVRRAALGYAAGTVPDADAPDGSPPPALDYDSGTGAGLFDEGFFMYGEDLDWCYRIQQAGWKIYYTPETQIVHYKGESTKKGELRYVRLFYGAMLRFAEKHFVDGSGTDGRPVSAPRALLAWAMCRAIQVAIVLRAVFSATGRLARVLRDPLGDAALSYAALAAAAAAWAPQAPVGFSSGYFWGAAPIYALVGVAGIAAAGGYLRGRRLRLRPVVAGLSVALLGIAAAGFFVKDIAFSRAALVLGFSGAGLLLLGRRLYVRRPSRVRRALLVGTAPDAARLQRLLNDCPPLLSARASPAFHVIGYVSDEVAEVAEAPAVRRLGPMRQLRDLARLHEADEVVFAAETLTNSAILGQMRALRDLPLQFTILAGYRDCLIGKASVVDLSAPLAEAERTVAPLRPEGARRAVEWALALLGVLAYPALRLLARLRPTPHLRTVAARAARMPSVLAGRRALVGFDPNGPHPPEAWGLQPGVVSVLDLLPRRPTSIVEAHRAYWFYARHQSAALDAEIVLRALLARPAPRAL